MILKIYKTSCKGEVGVIKIVKPNLYNPDNVKSSIYIETIARILINEAAHRFAGCSDKIGVYKKYDTQKVMELYSGFGYGYGSAYTDANPGDLYGDYQQYFLQINYGKVDCKFANMDLDLKLACFIPT